jgi:hypothetical protein
MRVSRFLHVRKKLLFQKKAVYPTKNFVISPTKRILIKINKSPRNSKFPRKISLKLPTSQLNISQKSCVKNVSIFHTFF